MNSTMVERVGEALREQCKAEFGSTWNYDVAWALARAAIGAMKEPSESMLWEGMKNAGWGDCEESEMNYRWQAMIDAALKP